MKANPLHDYSKEMAKFIREELKEQFGDEVEFALVIVSPHDHDLTGVHFFHSMTDKRVRKIFGELAGAVQYAHDPCSRC